MQCASSRVARGQVRNPHATVRVVHHPTVLCKLLPKVLNAQVSLINERRALWAPSYRTNVQLVKREGLKRVRESSKLLIIHGCSQFHSSTDDVAFSICM